MDANTFFIAQQMRQLASRAQGAVQQVRRAQTLRQVRDASHISIPSYLTAVSRSTPELRQLSQACETRAKELVQVDLAKMDAFAAEDKPAAERIETLKQAYGTLLQHDWVFLRGQHGTIYVNATRHVEQLISRLQSQVSAAS